MEFKKMSIDSYSYGTDDPMPIEKLGPGITNVNFTDPEFY